MLIQFIYSYKLYLHNNILYQCTRYVSNPRKYNIYITLTYIKQYTQSISYYHPVFYKFEMSSNIRNFDYRNYPRKADTQLYLLLS